MADVKDAAATAADTMVVKIAMAVVVGLGISAMTSPSPVALPAVGTISSLYLGGVAVAVGGGFFLAMDRYGDSDCGCGGDCGC